MAVIQKYIQQQELQPSSMPSAMPKGKAIMGQALAGLGDAISSMAGQIGKQNDAKANFAAEDAFRTLNLNVQNDFVKASETAPVDGTDFMKSFMTNSYQPRVEEFLKTVPQQQRERYETMLSEGGSFREGWEIKAATQERDVLYGYYGTQIEKGTNELAVAITQNPEQYDTYYKSGLDTINASGLPVSQKTKLIQEWDVAAQRALLDKKVVENPTSVVVDLGADMRNLSPPSVLEILSPAVEQKESGGNPAAVGAAGEGGSMQVMPDTARQIAKELKDPNFNSKWSDDEIRTYLADPQAAGSKGREYGRYYLGQQLNKYLRTGGPEAALIAYNAGPGKADEFLKHGGDWSKVPKSTQKYVQDVMGKVKGPNGEQMATASPVSVIRNPDGSVSTEQTITLHDKKTDKWVNIPKVINGELQNEDAVVELYNKGELEPTGAFDDLASAEAAAVGRTAEKDAEFNPQNVKFTFASGKRSSGEARTPAEMDKLNPDLVERVKTAYAGLGLSEVKLNSGYRDPAHNHAVGGAKGSQHVKGNAMDINVSGMPTSERIKLIQALSANGITGIGVGDNIIHADVGTRRSWGYAGGKPTSAVPEWAQATIRQHNNNELSMPLETAMKPVGTTARHASLPYADRQRYIQQADANIVKMQQETERSSAVQRYEMGERVKNEIKNIYATGTPDPEIDGSGVAAILGEVEYLKYLKEKDIATRTYNAKAGIETMSVDEMEQRVKMYEPSVGADPEIRASEQAVHQNLLKHVDTVQEQRNKEPAKAALAYEDVKTAFDQIEKGGENVDPAVVQQYVRLNLERQKSFNLKPGSLEPIPKQWAMEIGRALSRVPEVKGKNLRDVNASIVVQYDNLKKVFGEHTEEVIIHALSQYNGVGENTSKLITGYMDAIEAGGDPLGKIRKQQSSALDRDQVESVSNDVSTPPPAQSTAVNQEQVLRVKSVIASFGDDMTSEEVEGLRRRYGAAAVDAAMAGGG